MNQRKFSQISGATFAATLFILAIQVYLFETVLGSVLDGVRDLLPGAFAVSLVLSLVALFLAFRYTSSRSGKD